MASTFSFDVVSEYDQQELVNALDQTRREVAQRYDLKDSKTEIEQEKEEITINSESEMTLAAVTDILTSKVLRRNLSLKILDMQEPEPAAGSRVRQVIKLKKGISSDLAREISKIIRDNHPKAKPQIQGDAVRVTSASKDELQQIITTLKGKDFPVALQFTNYR